MIAWLCAHTSADDNKQAEIHAKQGVVYFKAAEYDDAIAEFKKAYELDKQSKHLFNIANAYYKKGDYKSAVDFFQQYLSVDPDGKFAQQALQFSADAKQALADEDAKARADAEAKR
jgi:colicin import membrane protein